MRQLRNLTWTNRIGVASGVGLAGVAFATVALQAPADLSTPIETGPIAVRCEEGWTFAPSDCPAPSLPSSTSSSTSSSIATTSSTTTAPTTSTTIDWEALVELAPAQTLEADAPAAGAVQQAPPAPRPPAPSRVRTAVGSEEVPLPPPIRPTAPPPPPPTAVPTSIGPPTTLPGCLYSPWVRGCPAESWEKWCWETESIETLATPECEPWLDEIIAAEPWAPRTWAP